MSFQTACSPRVDAARAATRQAPRSDLQQGQLLPMAGPRLSTGQFLRALTRSLMVATEYAKTNTSLRQTRRPCLFTVLRELL